VGNKATPPPPPNYGPLTGLAQSNNTIALQNNQTALGTQGTDTSLAAQQQQWAENAYNTNQAQNQEVINQDKAISDQNQAFAKTLQGEYTDTVLPEYQKTVDEANQYSTQAQKDLNIGQAISGQAEASDAARNNSQQQLESFGLNPGALKYAALDIGTRTQTAASEAAAGTQAGLQTDATRRALQQQAIATGQQMPGMAAGAENTTLGANSGAVNTGLATTASGANTMGTGTQYSSLGNQALGTGNQAIGVGTTGINSAVNSMNTGFQNQMASYNATNAQNTAMWSGLGTAAGMGFSYFAASGGAIPDHGPENCGEDTCPVCGGTQGKMFPDDHIIMLPARNKSGKLLQAHEAVRNFLAPGEMQGKHHGVFKSHEEAQRHFSKKSHNVGTALPVHDGNFSGHGSDDPQRQAYQKFALGGPSGYSGAVPTGASPSGGQQTDDVPAALNAGEFVVPKDVARWKGEEFFQNMIAQSRKKQQGPIAKPSVGRAPPPQGQRQAIPMGAAR
jgi:hypothetical protein